MPNKTQNESINPKFESMRSDLFPESMLKLDKLEITKNYDTILVSEFEKDLKNAHVLFYPSSGYDLNDLFYVNKSRLNEISRFNPTIFIHCDYMHNEDHTDDFEDYLCFPRFQDPNDHPDIYHPNGSFKWIISEAGENQRAKQINLFRLVSKDSKTVKWLLFYRGYFNEDVIKQLLLYKIKTPIVYSFCDGITHGMGSCSEKQVPTLLYPLLSKELGIRWIITEQSWESRKDRFIKQNFHGGKDECRQWLENINLICSKKNVKDALNLSDSELRAFLINELEKVPEYYIAQENRSKVLGPLGGLTLKTIRSRNKHI
jgi:hypothetical protein